MRPSTSPVQATELSQVHGARVPPHSTEAEQALLGALLLDCTPFGDVALLVGSSDFYEREHGAIFAAIAGLAAADRVVDVVTVFEALRASDGRVAADEMVYLNSLVRAVPSSRNAVRYAELVRQKSQERSLIAVANHAVELAWQSGPVSDRIDAIAALVARLDRGAIRRAPHSMQDLVVDALTRIQRTADGEVSDVWKTGIQPLDRLLAGGLRPGKVYGVAARPSVGKSAVARSLSISVATLRHPVLILSQEMPVEEVTDCVLAQLGQIDSIALQTGIMQPAEWSRLSEAAEVAASLPLWVDDEGGLTIEAVRAKARAVRGLKVLVLDYLQLCSSTLRHATTNDQVAEISKGLKRIALELDIAVVVLSQLNRDVEKRQDREPRSSDLRDSGAIEQDLDVVVLLWTVAEGDRADSSRLVGWKVDKHRGGPKGRFGMRFEPAFYRWRETTESLDRRSGGASSFE